MYFRELSIESLLRISHPEYNQQKTLFFCLHWLCGECLYTYIIIIQISFRNITIYRYACIIDWHVLAYPGLNLNNIIEKGSYLCVFFASITKTFIFCRHHHHLCPHSTYPSYFIYYYKYFEELCEKFVCRRMSVLNFINIF